MEMDYKHIVTISLLTVLLKFVLASPAYAYLDPGSGSFILQMIVAGIMSSLFVLKIYWKKMKSFFRSGSQSIGEDE
jgi:Na+/proline symporter